MAQSQVSSLAPEHGEGSPSAPAQPTPSEALQLSQSTRCTLRSSGRANVREKPTVISTPAMTLEVGQEVVALGSLTTGPRESDRWIYVALNDRPIGYVYGALLAPASSVKGPGSEVRAEVAAEPKLDRYGRKYAIVIGISDYQHLPTSSKAVGSLIDLKYAEEDAKAFASFLDDAGRSGGGWGGNSAIWCSSYTCRNLRHCDLRVDLGGSPRPDLYLLLRPWTQQPLPAAGRLPAKLTICHRTITGMASSITRYAD